MKGILSILLLFVFCFSVLRPVFPYVEYIFNYDYIVAVLCINKEKPELECNGKCYLDEQLAKVANTGQSQKEQLPTVEFDKFPIFYYQTNVIVLNAPRLKTESNSFGYVCSMDEWSLSPPTPPPQC